MIELNSDMLNIIKWWIQGDEFCPKSCPKYKYCMDDFTEIKICDQINKWIDQEKNDIQTKYFMDRIETNPEILNGLPIIKGTKIPVKTIVDFIHYGMSNDDIKQNLSQINDDDIEAAAIYFNSIGGNKDEN